VLGDPNTFGLRGQTGARGCFVDATDHLTLRFGGSNATDSIDSQHTAANYFAPLILTDSVSDGITWHVSKKWDMSSISEYDFPKTIVASGMNTGANIQTHYSLIMFNVGCRF
jgi:long-chain fatty acid transport protein